jgi:hypothetical protein
LATLQEGDSYSITFKMMDTDLLIKLKNETVSAKLLLRREFIKLIEFTTYKTHIEFTIYYNHEQHDAIAFDVKKEAILQLQSFLQTHAFAYVENEKVENPKPMYGKGSGTAIENFKENTLYLLYIGLAILGVFVVYQIVTNIDFTDSGTATVLRFVGYIGAIIVIIAGAFSRFK